MNMMLRCLLLVAFVALSSGCQPTGAVGNTQPSGTVDYKMSAEFGAANHLSSEQQILVVFVPARDTDEARQDAMYYCDGLRQWQDQTPGPSSPHRCVLR
jgi:hypothetical protein